MSDSAIVEKTKEKRDTDKKKDEETDDETKEPPKYKVIFHNDDYTPFDFVQRLLENIFRKSGSEAWSITMQVHKGGQGIAGVYSKQIAETKKGEATQLARKEGHPLMITIEPAEEGES